MDGGDLRETVGREEQAGVAPPPRLIADRYEIEQRLTRGGMGEIFVTVDRTSGKRVALKRLLQSRTHSNTEVMHFEREYQTLASLKHPRIIEVYDYGIDGVPFYTMELLDGHDLAQVAPVPFRDACRYLRDVASSLALLHARSLLHRDVSPRNVRMTSEGRCKLLDFGALTSFGLPNEVVGTAPMTPPEALYGVPLDQRLDLYALGALGYWLLTGRHAYGTRDFAMLPQLWQEPVPAPSSFDPGIPEELDQLVLALLSQDRVERPPSAADVIERLNAIAGMTPEDDQDVVEGYLAVPRLVGRETSFGKLKRALEDVVHGQGGTFFIDAAVGMGKTRILDDITLSARLSGVLAVRVDAELHPGPFGVLKAVVDALLGAAPSDARRAAARDMAFLAQLVPELRDGVESAELSTIQYPGERRAQIQAAFHRWIMTFCQDRALAILTDNLHAADQGSVGFLLGLAKYAGGARLLLVSTVRVGEQAVDAEAVSKLRKAAEVIDLLPLDRAETRQLASALFGNAPNLNRFAEWLHVLGEGIPFRIMELSRYAVSEKIARYADGVWLLPEEMPRAAEILKTAEIAAWKLGRLTADARRIAELLSLHEGTLDLAMCVELSAELVSYAQVFSCLNELVARAVLVAQNGGFCVAHTSLRGELLRQMDDAVRKRLHRKLADALLAKDRDDFRTSIEAGWHLMRAGEEARGADLLARRLARAGSARTLVVDDDLHAAVPGLEAAYRVYVAENRSAYEQAPLLVALVAAGYYVDWRLAERYGDAAIAVLQRVVGLTIAARLRPFLGPRLSLVLGILVAKIRFRFANKSEAVFKDSMVALLSSTTYLVGISLIRLEAERARHYAQAIAPFSVLGHKLAPAGVYEYSGSLALLADNRLSAARESLLRLLTRLGDDRFYRSLTSETRKLFTGGALYALGVLESFRDNGDVLYYATQLEAQGFRFYEMVAGRLRIAHHAYRAEMDLIPAYRDRLDLHAIQYGSAWQVEIWSPAAMITAYSNIGDVVGVKLMADTLEGLSGELPRLAVLAQVARATHALLRGELPACIEALERLHSEGKLAGYPGATSSLGTLATAYNQSGQYAEAKALCESVLATCTEEDLEFVVFTLKVELQLAIAEAALGDVARAAERVDVLIDKYAHNRGPVTRCALHQARARIALLANNLPVFQLHLDAMGANARATNNASLIALWKRLDRKSRARAEHGLKPAAVIAHTANVSTQLAGSSSETVRRAGPTHELLEEPVTQTIRTGRPAPSGTSSTG